MKRLDKDHEIPTTIETITDEQIQQLQRLELCSVCDCGLLAPQHHNERLGDFHAYLRLGASFFDFALDRSSEGEPRSVSDEARARCAEILNARNQTK